MSFSDDLTTFFDSLFGTTSTPQRGTLDITGVEPSDPNAPMFYGPTRAPDYKQQASLLQSRESAFTVADIDPNQFGSTKFLTPIPLPKIIDKIGYDVDLYTANGTTWNAWRTINIPSPGSFLKVEFLPSQINTSLENGTKIDIRSFLKSDQPVNDQPPNLANDNFYNTSRNILIQFDNTSNPLIVARPGDEFNVPFNSIYVTFKYFIPHFSIIIGNNASIRNGNDPVHRNMDLALGPGVGMWDSSTRHCVPFVAANTAGLTSITYPQGIPIGTSVSYTAGSKTTHIIFDPTNSGTPQSALSGITVGWITAINVSASDVTANGIDSLDLNIFVLETTTNTMKRFLGNIPIILSGQNATTNPLPINFTKTYNPPLRFTLQSNIGGALDQLVVQIANSASSSHNVGLKFSIEGYLYGPYGVANRATSSDGNYRYLAEAMINDPFPNDQIL